MESIATSPRVMRHFMRRSGWTPNTSSCRSASCARSFWCARFPRLSLTTCHPSDLGPAWRATPRLYCPRQPRRPQAAYLFGVSLSGPKHGSENSRYVVTLPRLSSFILLMRAQETRKETHEHYHNEGRDPDLLQVLGVRTAHSFLSWLAAERG